MTKTGDWLATWMAEDGAIDRLPEGWDDPAALIQKGETEAVATYRRDLVERARAIRPVYWASGLDTVERAAVLALIEEDR